ncbi:MAG TPA: MarR family winged helix-turn-helix transcriptional regulator [Vicinamibacterales bacterium]|nr:MarR family winged helix-turn-helix transcriptional regulator [Vicinamibacterales bacterium]
MKRRQRAQRAVRATVPADLTCACATARQVSRVLTHLYDGRLRRAGMEAPQFALMMTIEAHGPSSQATIGRAYALDKTTLSRNLRLLERQGWIASLAAHDRRERQFMLTGAGRTRLAAAKPEWKKAQDQLRSAMTAAQWDAMFDAFRIVTRAAQRVQEARG